MPDPQAAAAALRAAQHALESEVAAMQDPPLAVKACLVAARNARAALYEALGGKACKCCGALYTVETFGRLTLCGHRETVDDGVKYLETLRNCTCGSTLMVGTEVIL